ncbi:MAG TPA: DUF721 domain-containing protein [Saprospiraceae bacterium]|nr:DUF721 domain-containing protein [Saprospiraceae bacterium]
MKDNNHPLKELFEMMIKQQKMKPKLYEAKLRDSWPTLMGKLIDRYTQEISLRKNTLFLKITSAPLKNELVMSKDRLIALINKHLGEDFVKDVVIR